MIHRALALFLAFSIGCAYVPSTRLEYEPAAARSGTTLPYRVAVVPLEEDRPPRYWPSYGGRVFLSYIPLVPFFKVPYERLDERDGRFGFSGALAGAGASAHANPQSVPRMAVRGRDRATHG